MRFPFFVCLLTCSPLAQGQESLPAPASDPMSGANPSSTTNLAVPHEAPKKSETPEAKTPAQPTTGKTQDPMAGASATNSTTPVGEKKNDPMGGGAAATPQDPMSGSAASQGQPPPAAKTPPKPPLTPELANLNLPEDVTVENSDPDQVIFLPAGTYRQILQFPIDSPLMQKTQATRNRHGPEIKVEEVSTNLAPPNLKPIWIRYEGLEKIKIGQDERRGGIDLPVRGPADLKPHLWYAKSETADAWSSLFYFVFGGAGYSVANLAGWSVGNTREIPVDFAYRLIRK